MRDQKVLREMIKQYETLLDQGLELIAQGEKLQRQAETLLKNYYTNVGINPDTEVLPGFSLVEVWETTVYPYKTNPAAQAARIGYLDILGIRWKWNDGDDGPSFVGKGQIPTVSLDLDE